jgi:hypothetical protein
MSLMIINSMIYDLFFLVPEIIVILILARWGREEITARERVLVE